MGGAFPMWVSKVVTRLAQPFHGGYDHCDPATEALKQQATASRANQDKPEIYHAVGAIHPTPESCRGSERGDSGTATLKMGIAKMMAPIAPSSLGQIEDYVCQSLHPYGACYGLAKAQSPG